MADAEKERVWFPRDTVVTPGLVPSFLLPKYLGIGVREIREVVIPGSAI